MDKYINAQHFIQRIRKEITEQIYESTDSGFTAMLSGFRRIFEQKVNEEPAADVQKTEYASWRQDNFHKRIYYCSKCGRHIEDASQNPYEHFPYCHCGARMKKR